MPCFAKHRPDRPDHGHQLHHGHQLLYVLTAHAAIAKLVPVVNNTVMTLMPLWKAGLHRLVSFAVLVLYLLLLPAAYAQNAEITTIDIQQQGDQVLLSADIAFELKPELSEAARKGVSLYLTADLDIKQPRWWLDRQILSTEKTWRIQYNALTRQWRIGTGELFLPAGSLDEALDLLRHIRDWAILPIEALEPGVEYQGRLRLRLDTSRLARPFQVDALNSKAWSLMTPWKNFTFTISGDTPPD